MTTVRAAVCTGLHEPWKTEEIEIDPPGNREVRVQDGLVGHVPLGRAPAHR